ncbi:MULTISPECIES: MFS transporter [unclassified Jeotgalibaca]|uniref:MFS transporter n=1 Tax=unclassified Jeotgalibaca TaxID=2621505 RepID=UPI003FCF5CC7
MRKFGVKDQIGYAFGDVAGTVDTVMIGYVMVFCTYVLGISPAFMGSMFLFTKFWDAINDPIIGSFPDRWKIGKSGNKFKPYVMLGLIPLSLSLAFMFLDISSQSMMFKYIWVTVFYVLHEMAYTLTSVPYGAMSSVITSDPLERSKLSQARSLGAQISGPILMTIAPLILFNDNGEYIPSAFMKLATLSIAAIAISYFILVSFTTERIKDTRTQEEKPKFEYKRLIKQVSQNRPLLGVMFATIGNLFLGMGFAQLNAYLFIEYFKAPKLTATLGFSSLILVLVMYPFVPKLVARFGKRITLSGAIIVSLVAYAAMLIGNIQNPYIYIGLYYLSCVGTVGFFMLVWAMVNDCIDYHEYKFGERNDASLFSVYAFSRKLGSALGGTIGSYALVFAGYDSSLSTQAMGVGKNIYMILGLIMAIGGIMELIGVGVIYNLKDKDVKHIAATLKERRDDEDMAVEIEMVNVPVAE